MAITSAPPTPGDRRRHPSGDATPARTTSRMWSSRLIGALFLAGFLFYGTGAILVTSVVDGPAFLAGVSAQQTTLALGAFLMIATAAVDIGKAVFSAP